MKALALCILALGAATPAMAWGPNGHRITGDIAERNISGRTRAQVRMILGDETLSEASTWPDDMRSNPDPFWQREANPWHYVTVPAGQTYAQAGAPSQGDAMTALRRFTAVLRDPGASRTDKQVALRFVIHLVGDLHQPLHTGNGTDSGGNQVQVIFFGDRTNLHTVWDSGILERQQLSYTEYSASLCRQISDENLVTWWNLDPATWIAESVTLRDTVYPAETTLSYDYIYQHRPAMDRRLQQAGLRIAAYLDSVLDGSRRS